MGAEQSRGGGGGGPGVTGAVPPGVTTIGPSLQKRFAKGIQYNMKGQPFQEEYIPTPEIQVACIQWSYKVTDDVVKVEIWDIVDKGKTKKRDGLKMDTEDIAPTLDAEFIDVYKGTSGVIMMLDITKHWTYEYVQRELPKIPLDIPVIVMASHRDVEESRSVLTEDVQAFINELDRPDHAAAIYYMEASMKDGFGLKYLYRFFNVPFLELQRQTLIAQLRRNEEDLEAIKVELDVHEKSEEQDYDRFKELLERKRQGLPPPTGVATVSAGANETADPPAPDAAGAPVPALRDGTAMSLRSRLSPNVLQSAPLPAKRTGIDSSDQRIDNFVPEGQLDNSFLEQAAPASPPRPTRAKLNEVEISDSDEEVRGNPQVTLDQESPDEADLVHVTKPEESEEEEEEEEEEVQVMGDIEMPDSEPHSVGIIVEPPPLQPIDPTTAPRDYEPITCDQDEEVMTSREMTSREMTSSITSLEDLTISEEPAHPAPYINLDVLEQISTAPPIAPVPTTLATHPVLPTTLAPKSPRVNKKKSPKKARKMPPKKSLQDIQLTSSEEDEADVAAPAAEEAPCVVLASFEEPARPLANPPSTGAPLKLTHVAHVVEPKEEPTAPPPQANNSRRKKPPAAVERTELDDFFGEPTEASPPERKKKLKKKKKKKSGSAAGSMPVAAAGDYEQF